MIPRLTRSCVKLRQRERRRQFESGWVRIHCNVCETGQREAANNFTDERLNGYKHDACYIVQEYATTCVKLDREREAVAIS